MLMKNKKDISLQFIRRVTGNDNLTLEEAIKIKGEKYNIIDFEDKKNEEN